MPKILLVGGGREQLAGVIKGREMGFEVVVTDMSPSAPAAQLADYFYPISTNDALGNHAVAKQEAVCGVFTMGSETAVPVVAYVARKCGLPGYSEDTALAATSKSVMKRRFMNFRVPTPLWVSTDVEADAIRFTNEVGLPVVVKPSTSSGQRGLTLVQSLGMLAAAFSKAKEHTTDELVIVEKFYEGIEINVIAVVQNGKVEFLSLSERVKSPSESFGIAIEHVYPIGCSLNQRRRIEDACIRSIESIGLRNGVAYPQVIMSPDGPRVIEIAVRIPGGFMYELSLYASGIDLVEFTINQAVGRQVPIQGLRVYERHPSVHIGFLTALNFNGSGVVKKICGLEQAMSMSGIKAVDLSLKEGVTIPPLTYSGARFGAVVSTGQSRDESKSRCNAALSCISIDFH